MTILVAGGAGFIGSHLCDQLIDRGNIVVVADKLVMGNKNIMHLMNNKSFIFCNIDVANQESLDGLFEKYHFDTVYHLAANSDIQKGGKEPNIDFNDTFLTTRTILEAMRKYGVKNLFFASTSAVYGEKINTVLNECTGELMPVSYYGGAKLASEAIISSYVSMCDINAVIFRFPNVIGPRLTHGVIFDFIHKLRNNDRELEILGDGKQCKPYIYVLDLVKAIMQITDNFDAGENVYNISVLGQGTTVNRIAEIVINSMQLNNVLLKYTGGDRGWKGDVPSFRYDISKILSTGWKPEHSSDEAVAMTVIDALNSGM